MKGPPPSRANSNASYFDPLYECTGTTCSSYIFVNGIRVAKKVGTTVTYFHKDHISSTGIETDANGGNAQYCRYKPYGEIHSCSGGDKYKFTDQEYDSELGLYNYGAREYDPALTRFMSADTIVPDPADPQTLNRYSYCRNNPVMYVDPSGHLFLFDDAAILGSVVLTHMLEGAILGSALGASISAVSGGDVAMGALTGAISGAAFGAAGGYLQVNGLEKVVVAKVSAHAAAGAASGGVNAAVTGGDVGLGALTGGIAGGIGAYAGGFLPENNFPAQLAGRSLIGGVTGGIAAEIYWGSFGEGFGQGAWTAAYGFLFNETIGAAGRPRPGKYCDQEWHYSDFFPLVEGQSLVYRGEVYPPSTLYKLGLTVALAGPPAVAVAPAVYQYAVCTYLSNPPFWNDVISSSFPATAPSANWAGVVGSAIGYIKNTLFGE